VLRLGEGAGISVPTTLLLFADASWVSNRSMLVIVMLTFPEGLDLGGLLRLTSDGLAPCEGDKF